MLGTTTSQPQKLPLHQILSTSGLLSADHSPHRRCCAVRTIGLSKGRRRGAKRSTAKNGITGPENINRTWSSPNSHPGNSKFPWATNTTTCNRSRPQGSFETRAVKGHGSIETKSSATHERLAVFAAFMAEMGRRTSILVIMEGIW